MDKATEARTTTEARIQAELDAVLLRLRQLGQAIAVEAETTDSLDLAGDLFDNAQAVETRELGQLGVARLTARARRLKTALVRLQEGVYGRCEECGKPIPPARLRAILGVATCVVCQEALERAGGR
jgi:DnaK suppressor protein